MVFGETKLDSSYPTAQLMIEGFKKSFRSDRNANGGGGGDFNPIVEKISLVNRLIIIYFRIT